MSDSKFPVRQSSYKLTIIAWIVTILVSSLPNIVWSELFNSNPEWLSWVKMGLLFILILLTLFWSPLKPLRKFFILMLALYGLTALLLQINFNWPFLKKLFGNNVFDNRMQAEQTGKLVVSFAVIAILLLLGYKRRDFFLALGDLHAPIEPVRVLGFPKPTSWVSFGLQWSIYIAAALGIAQYLSLRPSSALLLDFVPIIPSILLYAGLNAFNEEMTYRAPMLATLEPVGGSKNALWMAAYFFGIAHYFGTPGGILGGVLSIFMGWILSKAMVETRGFFWAWWIHFLSDIVIFSFMTLMLLK